ncbi:MAG: CehA/McbA family metallohydrolase [Defluviitaleaceae bacterium]|nr:CehA/McbA family metallohydrolase [Defluviitaleaceae bacterium]
MKLIISVNEYCKITVQSCNSGTAQTVETVYCCGEHTFGLASGFYDVTVTRGKLYTPYRSRIEILDKDQILDIALTPIVRGRGLYSFDAHSHVSRDSRLTTGNLLSASTVMRGEGFNFFFAGSPYDNETHLEYINGMPPKAPYAERFAEEIQDISGEDFKLCIGNEIIKCRYGHVFMMNYEQRPPFSRYFDHSFDPWLFEKKGPEPTYEIDYIYKALEKEKCANSVAISAHPTSWWWHDNGEFVTNIAATLGFELLAGSIDAMVIMGYQSDHTYYQALWFDALKNGYFLPGVAETDAAFDTIPGRHLEFKTYVGCGSFDVDALCKGVKAGKNLVSSGPLLFLRVNGKSPGAILPWEPNAPVLVELEAIPCYEAPISRMQIIANGNVYKELNIHERNPTLKEALRLPQEGFILAKCYDFAGNVAITNPVYVRNTPFANHNYKANVNIDVYKEGRFEKSLSLQADITKDINVEAAGETKTIRLFELLELQKIFKGLYFGRFNHDKRYLPGEVPAAEFKIKEIKEILDSCQLVLHF